MKMVRVHAVQLTVMRDDSGDFVAAENFLICPTLDAHTTEAIALKDWSSSGAAPIIDDCFDLRGEFGKILFEHC